MIPAEEFRARRAITSTAVQCFSRWSPLLPEAISPHHFPTTSILQLAISKRFTRGLSSWAVSQRMMFMAPAPARSSCGRGVNAPSTLRIPGATVFALLTRIRFLPDAKYWRIKIFLTAMDNRSEIQHRRTGFSISLAAGIVLFLLTTSAAAATRCTRLQAQPDRWIAAQIDVLVKTASAAYQSDSALPAYERTLDQINNAILKCGLSSDPQLSTRYQTFFDYVAAASLDRQPDHELGFIVPDEQYFAETRQFVEIPEFLLNQTFLHNVSRFETLERAKAYLRQLNSKREPNDQLIFFSYKSRHLGTPDNDASYGRLLIVVPGNLQKNQPDKWVQFGVPDPGARARVRNVSVVTAVTAAGGAFNAYFKDYYRTYRRDGSITIKGRWELDEGDDNCAMCHKSGILPIFPVRGSVSAAEQQFVALVNSRFRAYGSPRFGGYLDARKLGPGLGFDSLEDRQRRFGPNFETTAAAGAMVCSSCHRSERLGALNWPMDKILIRSYVTGGQMPFGHQLNIADRRDLYTKLT